MCLNVFVCLCASRVEKNWEICMRESLNREDVRLRTWRRDKEKRDGDKVRVNLKTARSTCLQHRDKRSRGKDERSKC